MKDASVRDFVGFVYLSVVGVLCILSATYKMDQIEARDNKLRGCMRVHYKKNVLSHECNIKSYD